MPGSGKAGMVRVNIRWSSGFILLILVVSLLIAAPVSGKVHIINGSTSGVVIQDLINSSTTGDSIFLAGGTYTGSLTIDRQISFGALDTNDPPLITADDAKAGITLDVDGITLNGVMIRGGSENGLLVRSNNNRISAVTISGFLHGIDLQSATNNIFSNNIIVNNSIGVTADRSSRSNIFYLNRFDNTEDISGMAVDNIWFSGGQDYQYNGKELTGPLGNSWSGYTGTDSNGDGIGDTSYSLKVRQSILTSAAAGSETADRAPLVSSPEAYTLIRSVNATVRPGETPGGTPRESHDSGQVQDPIISAPYGGQPVSSSIPQSGPGTTATPPPGLFPGIILQYWWVIPILIVVAVGAGIWFERSFKRRDADEPGDPLRTQPPRNATIVTLPGQGTVTGGTGQEESPYFGIHLPPLLARKYQDAEYLGEGGVGRVFRAVDPVENRKVAVKIPVRFDEATGTQFTKELHIWQGLHHKNIVEVYAANVFPMPYIEMEYIESSLAMKKFPLEPPEAIRIITGVAEGLQYAHEQGIVHRDIKPENILLTADTTPKITDWGLAKALADTKHTGIISFSLSYAAPEQLAPNIYGDAGKWTDIYQLGVLFYEMVTGRLPFCGTGMGEVTQAILHATPQPPEVVGKDAAMIRRVIMRCMMRKPDERYQDVSEILAELKTSAQD